MSRTNGQSPDRLRGQTALVTGGGRRIGAAVTAALAERGVHVAVHYNTSPGEAEKVAAAARAQSVEAVTVPADLGRPEHAETLIRRASEQIGPLDILINNASIFPKSRLDEFTVEDLAANVQVNAMAPLILSRKFAAQGRPGCIVNFLDTRITDYDAEHAAYHLSKRMLYALTRMCALEFAPAVRVNGVAPGLILPPAGKDRAYLEQKAHTNPLNRVGDLKAITGAVTFLLESDFITGQVVFVDGGRHLKGRVYG